MKDRRGGVSVVPHLSSKQPFPQPYWLVVSRDDEFEDGHRAWHMCVCVFSVGQEVVGEKVL